MSFDPSILLRLAGASQGGQGAGGMLEAGLGFAATAALTPFLGPLAPIVGPIVGKLATGLIKNLLGGVASLFGKKSKAPQEYNEKDRSYLNMLNTMGETYRHQGNKLKFKSTEQLFDKLDDAKFARATASRNGDTYGMARADQRINAIRSEIAQRFDQDFPAARNHEWYSARY